MSKNYDLYPASERKIDNWRRRILGYEKMKRDMQRQIQILKNKNKKQKEVIDKLNIRIEENKKNIDESGSFVETYTDWKLIPEILEELLDILEEVSE